MTAKGGKSVAGDDNVVPFGAAIGAALDAPMDAPDFAQPTDEDPFDGYGDDEDLDVPVLPAGCPVRALGMKGQNCWYLDVQGQIITLAPRDHGKNNIIALFSPRTSLPMKYWPRWSEEKTEGRGPDKIVVRPSEIVGFKQDEASEALIGACGRAGIFDAIGRVRGRGAHEGKGRALVLHVGDKVMVTQHGVDGKAKAPIWHDPGLVDGYVYPADAPSPRPDAEPVAERAGELILGLLQTWNWRRPTLDAMLALGFIGQGYICGALPWRSHLFVTGGKGTGKSTLNGKDGVFDRLFGKGALRTGNASEAAVRQRLGASTIPVIFDEFEASEFNGQKTAAMVELARVASSGAEMHRGGQDHQAHEFVLKSAFQFSAIIMPQLQPQDRSRFAILELLPFADGTPAVDLDAHKLPPLGRALMRRMADGWPRFRATFKAYSDALEAGGHRQQRSRDQYGTLLACADLLLYDHAPDATLVAHWASECRPEGLSEMVDAVEEHDACITHLATREVQASGGAVRESLSAWVQRVEGDDYAADRLPELGIGRPEMSVTRAWLQTYGLKLVNLRPTKEGLGAVEYKRGGPGYLAVASEQHVGLAGLFRDSRWQRGAWAQALARTPGAERSIKVKFAGRSLRAVCVPLEAVIELDPPAQEGDA